ncbi:MAG: rhomboid family intramembrane serine protease [Sandaracinaceae bacterium]
MPDLSLPFSATFALIALCVAVSLPGFWALKKREYRDYFVFVPNEVAKGKGLVGALLSHFAHGDVGHLGLNMLVLYFFGPNVENALGVGPFLIVYAVSGLLGTLAVFVLRRKDPKHSALGASGAIAGIVFATVVVAPTSTFMILLLPIPIPAPIFAVLYLVASSLMMGRRDHIAHEAHIGGAVAGLVAAGLLYPPGFGPLIQTVQSMIG